MSGGKILLVADPRIFAHGLIHLHSRIYYGKHPGRFDPEDQCLSAR